MRLIYYPCTAGVAPGILGIDSRLRRRLREAVSKSYYNTAIDAQRLISLRGDGNLISAPFSGSGERVSGRPPAHSYVANT